MTEQLILSQLYTMPENLKMEVLDFTNYLVAKYQLKQSSKKYPVFGSAKDKYVLSSDFDEPLEDFKDYM